MVWDFLTTLKEYAQRILYPYCVKQSLVSYLGTHFGDMLMGWGAISQMVAQHRETGKTNISLGTYID